MSPLVLLQISPCVASSPSPPKPCRPSELVSQDGSGWCRLGWAGLGWCCHTQTSTSLAPPPSLASGRRPPSRERSHRHGLLLGRSRAGGPARTWPPHPFPPPHMCGAGWQSMRAEPWVVTMCVFLSLQLIWEVGTAHSTSTLYRGERGVPYGSSTLVCRHLSSSSTPTARVSTSQRTSS